MLTIFKALDLLHQKKKFIDLLVMGRRNSLKKHLGFSCINLCIYPLSPSCQTGFKSFHTIHVFEYLVAYLNVIPSATQIK